MKRKAFVAPRRLDRNIGPSTKPSAFPAATPPLSVFDCLFSRKGHGAAEGSIVLRGRKAQLLDLQLREKATDSLPPEVAAALHAAYAGGIAAGAAGGPLWWEKQEPPQITLGQWQLEIEDDAAAAVSEAEWLLRQHVGVQVKRGKPQDAAGPAISLDSIGKSSSPGFTASSNAIKKVGACAL